MYSKLIIDTSNFYMRAYSVGQEMTNKMEDGSTLVTGGIYTFLRMVRSVESRFLDPKNGEVYFLFDNCHSGINRRKEIDPEYKSNRTKKDEGFYRSLDILQTILLNYKDNWFCVKKSGFEADDLVYPFIKEFLNERILLISNDLDWFRGVSDRVHVAKYEKAEGMDEPISLGNDVILLEVQRWIPINHEADLGATRVQALFDDTENEIHNCINHEFTLKVLPPSILLDGKVESIKVYTEYMDEPTYGLNTTGNFVSILGDETMEGEEEDVAKAQQLYGKDWLYVKQGDTYDKELELKDNLTPGGEAYTIHLFMEDYARPRKSWGWKVEGLQEGEYSWQGTADDIDYINKDYRYVNIVLETKFIWNGQVYFRYDRMPIKQYNTITVFYKPQNDENEYTCCGFSREDLSEKNEWGFHGNNNNTVYIPVGNCNSYNGATNLMKVNHNGNFWETFGYSAMGVAQQKGIFAKVINNGKVQGDNIRTDNDELESNPTCWYLPSRYEMEGLMLCSEYVITNIKVCESEEDDKLEWYWTSTVNNIDSGITSDTWAYRLPANYIPISNSRDRSKREKFNIRQARRFPEEYEYAW